MARIVTRIELPGAWVEPEIEVRLADPVPVGVDATGLLVAQGDAEPDIVWFVRPVPVGGEVPDDGYRFVGMVASAAIYVRSESIRHLTIVAAMAEAQERGVTVEEVLGLPAPVPAEPDPIPASLSVATPDDRIAALETKLDRFLAALAAVPADALVDADGKPIRWAP